MLVKLVDPNGDLVFPVQEMPQLPAPGDVIAWTTDLVIRPGPARYERLGVGGASIPRWVVVLVADVVKKN